MLVLLSTALAGDADGGLQVHAFPGLTDKVGGWLEGEVYEVDYPDLSAEYDCYDLLGVRDFNLDIPVEQVTITPRQGELDVDLRFGEIRGEDMVLYAVDSEWTDLCVEFETTVDYVSLTDGRLQATVTADVDRDAIHFAFVGTPSVTGDLDTDIDWVPDDLVLYFFEDEVFDTLSETLADVVPGYLDEVIAETALELGYEEFQFSVEPVAAAITPDGVRLEADAVVGWSGDDGCPMTGVGGSDGRNPALSFGDGGGSSFAVGLTERSVADLFLALYEDGYFCFTEANIQEFLTLIQDLFDPAVGGLAATAELREPPELRIDREGIHFGLEAMEVEVTGELDGRRETLLEVTADLSGTLEVALDQQVSAFTLSIVALELDLTRFHAAHLVSGKGEAEDHLRDFLEGWVVDWAVSSAQGVALYGSAWHLYGQVLFVDRLEYEDGGLALYVTLYDEDDPEVDTSPPDTSAEATSRGRDAARVSWSGTDDREGALAWQWQLDEGGWSGWTTDSHVDLDALGDGLHTVEVQARDAWWNVDPTPASLTFDVASLPEDPGEPGGCGCATGGGAGWAAVLLAGAWARRRQRRSSRPPHARHSSGL